MLGRLIRWKTGSLAKLDRAALRLQISCVITNFVAIRGWPVLLNNQTAAVMRRQFDTFVTTDVRGIENPETILAVVCLKDMECYEQVKEIQADKYLRGSAFGKLALNHLADQVTQELLRRAAKTA